MNTISRSANARQYTERKGGIVAASKAPREDRTYVDAEGVTIHYYTWRAASPQGVVQLVHGLGEHALRYEWLVGRLTDAGFTVYADDHRGHGRTGEEQYGGDLSKLGRLGPGGMPATVESVRRLTGMIAEEAPDLPPVLLGHSWGSIIAQILLNSHSMDFCAAILSGTAYRTLRHMNGGDLNARHKKLGTTGYEWLSRDPAVAEAAVADPYMFSAKALKLFGLVDSLRLLGIPAKGIENDLPLLIQVGSDDTFGGTRSAELLAESYLERGGLTDVELIVYTDARHEIFNETNKEEVVDDTLAWLADRLG
jgi:alpha-beta hydrolase superfamily lysophospholipase